MASPTLRDRRSLRGQERRRARRRTRARAAAAALLGVLTCALLVWSAAVEGVVAGPGAEQTAAGQGSAETAGARVAPAAGAAQPVSHLSTELPPGATTAEASEVEHLLASETELVVGRGAAGASGTDEAAPAPSPARGAGPPPHPVGSSPTSAVRLQPPPTTSGAPTTPATRGASAGTTAAAPRPAAPSTTPAAQGQPAAAPGAVSADNPLAGAAFWVDPDGDAARAVAAGGDPSLRKIADAPGAVWLGDWVPTGQVRHRTEGVLEEAGGRVPVMVLYALPGRDCGGYSSGGLAGPAQYGSWVREVAAGIAGRRAVVVLEPDALAQMDCLGEGARAERTSMLRDAVAVLAGSGATTYLDAGNSGWVDATTMAGRLREAGVARARGFALNTSNFQRTAQEEGYGERLSAQLGGSHYVVDTSRNGNGPASGDLSWCNPRGRALGETPTTRTRAAHADAYLWVKRVGESDGGCGRGEPAAGTWWPQYAVGLARGAS